MMMGVVDIMVVDVCIGKELVDDGNEEEDIWKDENRYFILDSDKLVRHEVE